MACEVTATKLDADDTSTDALTNLLRLDDKILLLVPNDESETTRRRESAFGSSPKWGRFGDAATARDGPRLGDEPDLDAVMVASRHGPRLGRLLKRATGSNMRSMSVKKKAYLDNINHVAVVDRKVYDELAATVNKMDGPKWSRFGRSIIHRRDRHEEE